MLDLVSEGYKQFQIFALWRIGIFKVLPQAFCQLPGSVIPVNSFKPPGVPSAVKRLNLSFCENSVKQCCPRNYHENYIVCGPKSDTRTIVIVYGQQRRFASLL